MTIHQLVESLVGTTLPTRDGEHIRIDLRDSDDAAAHPAELFHFRHKRLKGRASPHKAKA